MSNWVHDDMLDASLTSFRDVVAAGNMVMVVTAGQPANRAQAAALSAGSDDGGRVSDELALPVGAFGAPQDGTPDGRSIVKAAEAAAVSVAVTKAAGQDLHFAFYDATQLWAVVQETSDQALTTGNVIDLPAITIRIPDAA